MSETIPIISFLCDLPVIVPRSVKQSVWILRSAISSSTAFDRAARTAMASAASGDPTRNHSCIMVNHRHYIMSQEPKNQQLLNTLHKITKSRGAALQQLLQLSGRSQLVTAQINKAAGKETQTKVHEQETDESEDEEDDVEEHFYGEKDNDSELSSDDGKDEDDTLMEEI
uniref:Uncharacterized protein n=1 Tax=Brassica campestris TaxID=3711 RepID=M4EKL0_BRACM